MRESNEGKTKNNAALPEGVSELGERIRTQGNRGTSNPIFVVEQEVMICGIDPVWGGEIAWLDFDHSQIHDAEEVERLEQAYRDTGSEPDGFTRSGFVKRWEFVTACFTEQGCKDYLDANGHNLRNPRIYVYSGYRNAEWIGLREWLAAPAPAESKPAEPVVDDVRLLDLIAAEYLHVEPFAMPTGQGDADVGWEVRQSYEPGNKTKIIATAYRDDIRAALREAYAALRGDGAKP